MEGIKMGIKPLGSNILTKKSKIEEKSKMGLIVGDGDSDSSIAEVIAVGKDVEDIKEGDKIMYASFAGQEIANFLVLSESDIIGKIII